MANPLGPIEIDCDAPPYAIVRACQRIGIRTPEDVRWARLSHFLTSPDRTRTVLSPSIARSAMPATLTR